MFIPRGKLVHDNLATSYVLIEPLVEDLQEGGFSGLIEVVLRDTDGFIILAGGNVAGAIQKSGDAFSLTTLAHLAERARLERGRVAVYAYPRSTAATVAGRMNAQPLYSGLSTEFTDTERMIRKLAREVEREWFIEVNTESNLHALIHLFDGRCQIINSNQEADEPQTEAAESEGDAALESLLRECRGVRGTFDVFFAGADESPAPAHEFAAFEASAGASSPVTFMPAPEAAEQSLDSRQSEALRKLSAIESSISSSLEAESFEAADFSLFECVDAPDGEQLPTFPAPLIFEVDAPASDDGAELESLAADLKSLVTGDLMPDREAPGSNTDIEVMADLKRLMAEIARTIEEAAQSVGRHDGFSMCLRAGQLKLADRYRFLDPFGGEFEYLGGEIVFVGNVTAQEFVEGFSEALKLAIQSVTQSTAYPERFRAYVAEDLKKLLAKNQAQFERFGLDDVIEQLAIA
jgi:hypothetical protein